MNPALAQAVRLTPVVEKVHGALHPELTEVRELTESLAAAKDPAEIEGYYATLRKVTSDYAIPDGVCEGFESAYRALEESEQAWREG